MKDETKEIIVINNGLTGLRGILKS